MQVIFLTPAQTVLLDVIAWLVIQLTISFCSSRIPLDWLNPDQPFFQTFTWEQGGNISCARLETPDSQWLRALPRRVFDQEPADL